MMGGFHPSMCPEEASQYADSIVIGDAEDTWPQIIRDAEKGALQPRYISAYPSFGDPVPDRSLFLGKAYAPIGLAEFNRGCRFNCDFCSIRALYQGKMRQKSMENVLRDLDACDRKHLFFADDNFYADTVSLKDMLLALKRRRQPRRWSCQISSDIVKHPELVSLMAEAGCISVTVGFESLERKNREMMHKSWMEDDDRRSIRAFQEQGIMVYGTFIIGYDHDTPDVFERLLSFALDTRLFLANFNPLIPTPGTPLYARLQSEGRLLYDRWWLHKDYRWGDCVFRPLRMTPEELAAGCFRLRQQFYSTRSMLARFPGLSIRKTTPLKAGLFVVANRVSRRELDRKYGQALVDHAASQDCDSAPKGSIACT